ncbi:MAG: MAE_28990/MAE_18760 family HEPN-like nuclease [Methanoregula sp.]|nr:MAE_28990/MAE_18760 family HEPN-like nuclease [Methanoregula sp.]
MTPLDVELQKEIDWRIKEIATIRSIPLTGKLQSYQNAIIIKYSTVALYSLWEGFVVCGLRKYICEINKLNINSKTLHPAVITHDIDIKFLLGKPHTDFDDKILLIEYLNDYLNNPVTIGMDIPTSSNVNFKRINIILKRFNIPLMHDDHKTPLNHLVRVRDDAAHGEFSIPTNLDTVQELSFTAINAMTDLACNISDAYNYQFYLK